MVIVNCIKKVSEGITRTRRKENKGGRAYEGEQVLVTGDWARLVDVMVARLFPAGTLVLPATRLFRIFAMNVATSALIACLIFVIRFGPPACDLSLPAEKTSEGLFLLGNLLGRRQLEHRLR